MDLIPEMTFFISTLSGSSASMSLLASASGQVPRVTSTTSVALDWRWEKEGRFSWPVGSAAAASRGSARPAAAEDTQVHGVLLSLAGAEWLAYAEEYGGRLGCRVQRPAWARESCLYMYRGQRLVGTARFELATPCTPCKCATRLRHVPTGCAC